jgi:4-hydroxy-tetrahydrodipicolinate reductase
MVIKICLAGVSGWTGQCVAKAILSNPELKLVAAVARKTAGQDMGEVLGNSPTGIKISGTIEEALKASTDVFVDYTSAIAVKSNVLTALQHELSVVIGSSGLTADDYAEIDSLAKKKGVGVIAAGNFSITAALAKHFSL